MRALFFGNGGALLIVECERWVSIARRSLARLGVARMCRALRGVKCALERIPEHTQCSTLFCRWRRKVINLVWCCVWIFAKPLHTGWLVFALDGPYTPADLTAFGLRFELCSIPALRECGLVCPADEPILNRLSFVLARDDELVMMSAHGFK